MRIYESTFILSPQADDAAFDRQINAITDLIKNNDGKTIHEDRWGIRRMAYPIQKFTQGFYTKLVFEGNNKVLTELERFYKLEEPYIRYLTILFEGDLNELTGDDKASSAETTPAKEPVKKDAKATPVTKTSENKEPEQAKATVKESSTTAVAEEVKPEEPKPETAATEPVGDKKPEKTEE